MAVNMFFISRLLALEEPICAYPIMTFSALLNWWAIHPDMALMELSLSTLSLNLLSLSLSSSYARSSSTVPITFCRFLKSSSSFLSKGLLFLFLTTARANLNSPITFMGMATAEPISSACFSYPLGTFSGNLLKSLILLVCATVPRIPSPYGTSKTSLRP